VVVRDMGENISPAHKPSAGGMLGRCSYCSVAKNACLIVLRRRRPNIHVESKSRDGLWVGI